MISVELFPLLSQTSKDQIVQHLGIKVVSISTEKLCDPLKKLIMSFHPVLSQFTFFYMCYVSWI